MKLKRLALIPLICTTLAAFGAPTPPPEKLLPADTLIVATIPDYSKVSAASKQSPLTQLWNDPAMKAFHDKFMGKLQSEVIAPLEREFGIKFADYENLAQGQITLGITLNGYDGKNENPPGFLILLDAKDKSDALKKNLDDLKKKWADSGKQTRVEKIRDIDFSALAFTADDLSKTMDKAFPSLKSKEAAPKKASTKTEWFIGQSDTLLIIGNVPSAIEKVLVHQTGGAAPSLSDQNAFANNYNKYFRDNLAYGWVDLKSFVDMAIKSVTQSAGAAKLGADSEKIIKALGFGSLETLSFSVNQNADGSSVLFHIQAPEDSRQGILKVLSFETKDANPPPFVPSDAVRFTRFRLNLQKVYYRIEMLLTQIDSQYATLLKTLVDLAGKDKDPKFELRTQLIDNLGDDLISYEKLPRGKTLEDLASAPSIFLIGSRKPEELADAIGSLVGFLPTGSTGAKIKQREFLGRKIYTMSLSSVSEDGKRTDSAFYYTASGGYVAISTDLPMIEEYLRGNPAKSLAEAAGLNEAAQKVGGMSTGLFSYANEKETTRVSLEAMKKESGGVASLFSANSVADQLGMGGNDAKLKEWLDFSLLPPFDQIAKYFHISVWSGALNADGFTFKMFDPAPPELKK
jgi:hypothetical protein